MAQRIRTSVYGRVLELSQDGGVATVEYLDEATEQYVTEKVGCGELYPAIIGAVGQPTTLELEQRENSLPFVRFQLVSF